MLDQEKADKKKILCVCWFVVQEPGQPSFVTPWSSSVNSLPFEGVFGGG